MIERETELRAFIIEAKRQTYAAGVEGEVGPRAGTKDIRFVSGPWSYLDSYYGGIDFLGQEAVWFGGRPVWGMNYYGRTDVALSGTDLPRFLKAALLAMPAQAPYRGPERYVEGDYEYRCSWRGSLADFAGREEILYRGLRAYALEFHGGTIN
jgi:hypothetical protein